MTSEMFSRAARLATFERAHQPSKKRTSTQGKKKAGVVEWPHKRPAAIDLARAGFFFRPELAEDEDNVQCFFCNVKLNGWEPEDDPVKEHLAHKSDCDWAIALSVISKNGYEEMRDPQCEELLSARKATFSTIMKWPHDSKRNWKCKSSKMAEAGWSFDASPECEDGAVCHYCGTELDGWEPKDDPFVEHQKRRPDCRFFSLMLMHHGSERPIPKKGKGGKARGSAASKASRMSGQSVASSAFQDNVSMPDLATDPITGDDEEEPRSQSKSKKSTKTKTAKPKRTKKASEAPEASSQQVQTQDIDQEDLNDDENATTASKPTKTKGRKAASKAANDDSTIETAPKKRGRPKKQTTDTQSIQQRVSDASAQLQRELEDSMSDELSQHQPSQSSNAPRGVKRNSDGSQKSEPSVVILEDFPEPPKATKIKKAKTGSSASRTSKPSVLQHVNKMIWGSHHDTVDEDEISAELAKIEAEQIQRDEEAKRSRSYVQDKENNDDEIVILQDEIDGENTAPRPARQDQYASPAPNAKSYLSPSPSGSDKENVSSIDSAVHTKSITRAQESPAKSTRIPLAQTTPNRPLQRRIGTVSPAKKLGLLSSTTAWTAIDLDNILLLSDEQTPGRLQDQLMNAAGVLSEEERNMTVEAWIRWKAGHSEEEFRRKCEEKVTIFEREGNRALDTLHGLAVTA